MRETLSEAMDPRPLATLWRETSANPSRIADEINRHSDRFINKKPSAYRVIEKNNKIYFCKLLNISKK